MERKISKTDAGYSWVSLLTVTKRIGFSCSLCAVILATFFWLVQDPVQAQRMPPVDQDVVFLLDNSPSTISGVGAPDGNPTDPQDVRLRLTRFAVGALSLFTSTTQQRVGALSFARDVELLVPLTPVEDWARADQASITALDMGSGTDFAAALGAAEEMFEGSACTEASMCDVVLISDGVFDNPARDQQTVEAALKALRARGIRVHLLAFAEPDAQSHAIWGAFLDEGLLTQYETQITARFGKMPQEVYAVLFDILNAADLFDDFSSVAAPEVITREVAPFRRWVKWQIVADAPDVNPVFSVDGQVMEASVRVGSEYWFWIPKSGTWTVEFTGSGMVYYRYFEMVEPVLLNVRDFPDRVDSGQDISVVASLTAGGKSVLETGLFSITLLVDGVQSATYPLSQVGSRFSTELSAEMLSPGTYTATFQTDVAPQLGMMVDVVTETFYVNWSSLPTLDLSVPSAESISPGQPFTVSVMTKHCSQGCVPYLWMVTPQFTRSISLTPTSTTDFYTSIILTQTSTLLARLGV